MRILDHTGDTCVAWSLDDPASLAEAEALFERLRAERKIPFARAVGAPAADAERVSRFDPAAEEIVWVRPVQGG
ncbi:MAG: hypothetical protein FJW95_15880 [Actinobacteria bacterium]|nr:hypothetical protein [Actinomycetota bacterium]